MQVVFRQFTALLMPQPLKGCVTVLSGAAAHASPTNPAHFAAMVSSSFVFMFTLSHAYTDATKRKMRNGGFGLGIQLLTRIELDFIIDWL